MTEQEYARERAQDFLDALGNLWSATDHPEWQDISLYTDDEIKAVLGEWIHVRKACDAMFDRIRTARPELPGWDPIQKDRPVDERLAEADGSSA